MTSISAEHYDEFLTWCDLELRSSIKKRQRNESHLSSHVTWQSYLDYIVFVAVYGSTVNWWLLIVRYSAYREMYIVAQYLEIQCPLRFIPFRYSIFPKNLLSIEICYFSSNNWLLYLFAYLSPALIYMSIYTEIELLPYCHIHPPWKTHELLTTVNFDFPLSALKVFIVTFPHIKTFHLKLSILRPSSVSKMLLSKYHKSNNQIKTNHTSPVELIVSIIYCFALLSESKNCTWIFGLERIHYQSCTG